MPFDSRLNRLRSVRPHECVSIVESELTTNVVWWMVCHIMQSVRSYSKIFYIVSTILNNQSILYCISLIYNKLWTFQQYYARWFGFQTMLRRRLKFVVPYSYTRGDGFRISCRTHNIYFDLKNLWTTPRWCIVCSET